MYCLSLLVWSSSQFYYARLCSICHGLFALPLSVSGMLNSVLSWYAYSATLNTNYARLCAVSHSLFALLPDVIVMLDCVMSVMACLLLLLNCARSIRVCLLFFLVSLVC